MMSFTYTVLCDESVTEDGGAVFQGISVDDKCSPEVTYLHAAGCHKVEVKPGTNTTETVIVKEVEVKVLSDFIYDNHYVFGVILIILGAPIAFFG